MSIKKKRLLGILLSFVMVLGLMPGMKLMVYADDTTPNTDNTGKLVIEMDFDIDSWPPYDDSPRDIPVIITWNDNNDKDGNRPESIVVRLLADGVEIADAELNAGNNWRYTFTGLPRFDENKEKIKYTITEDPVEWYTAEINGFNIRNNYNPNLTSLTVTQIWDDANNEMQSRPESIAMTLSNGMTVLLNDQNNWTATIKDLPTRLNRAPANYTWTEQKVLGYDKIDEVTEGTVTTFTNRRSERAVTLTAVRTPRIAGESMYGFVEYKIRPRSEISKSDSPMSSKTAGVKWIGADDRSLRQESTQQILMGDGEADSEQRTANLELTVTLNAPEGADLSGLELAIDGPDPQLKKTLTYADVEDGNISLGKVLPGPYLIRDTNADTLIEGHVMDAENSKVADAVYAASGASARLEFQYTWKLQEPIDYKEVEEDYDPNDNIGKLSLDILGPDDRMPKTITYSQFKDGKYELSDLVPGVYTVIERNAETLLKYYTLTSDSITGMVVEVKAGGTATAKLSNKYVTQKPDDEFVDIPVTKTWNDNNNADGNRPASVTVRLYADGVEEDSHVLTAAENWKFTFKEKPRYQEDNKTEIVYTVNEDVVAMYTTTINGHNLVNDYQPEVTSVSVSNIWDDNNNEQNVRPDSIAMSLSDGEKIVKVVVLNENNGWTATVNNLPTVVDGQPAVYRWKEQQILNYSLESVTQDGNHMIFTNKVWERPETVATTPVSTELVFPYTTYKKETNKDGSITTTATTYYEDGSITELVEREWVKGKKKGRKNTKETVMDPDGKVISVIMETISFSKKQTKTETKDIKLADGYSFSSTVKTYKSGKQIYRFSETLESGVKQEYAETKKPDGTLTRKVMDTNTKGKSTLTVTTKELVKTVTKYKVTGDGRIRLTSFKTEGDTVIIPKTVTFNGKKYMIVSLGKNLFKGMEGIKEIYIYAENLKKIYAGAFNGVPADAKFYIKATTTNCKKIVRMIRKSGFGKVDYTKI